MVRALRSDAVLKRVPESAKDDFHDLTITLEDMLEGLEAARAKPAPSAPAPDLFVAAADAHSTKVARTPAETMRVCIEGWYGGFLKTILPDWREREQDLQGLIGFASKFEDVGDLVAQVAAAGCETLVTGEIKLHQATEARAAGLAVVARAPRARGRRLPAEAARAAGLH
jgi:hypothetical protein